MQPSALKTQLDADIKTALLGGDKQRAETLRGLKSAILYEEVAQKARETGLSDAAILTVLARESKKRTDAIDIYAKAGETERAAKESAEKAIIDAYLPAQLSDDALAGIVDEVLAANPDVQMGPAIGLVRQKVGSQADGGRISAMVKAKLQG